MKRYLERFTKFLLAISIVAFFSMAVAPGVLSLIILPFVFFPGLLGMVCVVVILLWEIGEWVVDWLKLRKWDRQRRDYDAYRDGQRTDWEEWQRIRNQREGSFFD